MRLCDSRDRNSRCAQACSSEPGLLPTIIQKRDVRGVGKRDVSDGEGLSSTEAYQETDGPIRIVQGDSGKITFIFEVDFLFL